MIVITTTVNTRTNNNRPDTDLYADMPPQGRAAQAGPDLGRTSKQRRRRSLRRQAPVGAGPLRPDPTRGRRGGSRGEPTTTLPPSGGSRRGRARGPPTATSATSTPTSTTWLPPRPTSPLSRLEASPPEPRSSTAPNNHLDTPSTPLRCAWRCDRIGQRRTRRRFETARRCPGL